MSKPKRKLTLKEWQALPKRGTAAWYRLPFRVQEAAGEAEKELLRLTAILDAHQRRQNEGTAAAVRAASASVCKMPAFVEARDAMLRLVGKLKKLSPDNGVWNLAMPDALELQAALERQPKKRRGRRPDTDLRKRLSDCERKGMSPAETARALYPHRDPETALANVRNLKRRIRKKPKA